MRTRVPARPVSSTASRRPLTATYAAPHVCEQKFDVGVWQAPWGWVARSSRASGLDLAFVGGHDLTPFDGGQDAPIMLWDAVKPALIAEDAKFAEG